MAQESFTCEQLEEKMKSWKARYLKLKKDIKDSADDGKLIIPDRENLFETIDLRLQELEEYGKKIDEFRADSKKTYYFVGGSGSDRYMEQGIDTLNKTFEFMVSDES